MYEILKHKGTFEVQAFILSQKLEYLNKKPMSRVDK